MAGAAATAVRGGRHGFGPGSLHCPESGYAPRMGHGRNGFNPKSEIEKVKMVKMLEWKLFGKTETIPKEVW